MINSPDNSQNIKVGDNVNLTNSNANFNLREISGQVTNSIQQLPDNSEEGKTSIKQLLSQLQNAIETS